MEMTLVGTNAVTSPACVSMIGRPVSEPALDCALAHLLDVLLVDARAALEQARVQVEHVAGECLAARRTAQQQRDLPVGNRLLGEVVVYDQRVFAVFHEELAHRAAGVGRDVLHGGGGGGGGGDDDGVLEGIVLLELAHDIGDGRLLLTDRDVDALHPGGLLVDDRVDRERGLAGLAVADDELALAATDRHHRVDRLVAGLHRLADRFAVDDARGHALDGRRARGVDRTLAIDRPAKRIDHAAEELAAHGHLEDAAGGLDLIALAQVLVVAEHHRPDGILLEVQRQAEGVARELQHLAVTRVGQAVDARDAVGDRNDRADVACLRDGLEALDPLLDEIADFTCLDGHWYFPGRKL
jgi:hypothetical protein